MSSEFMINCITNDIKILLTRKTGRKILEKLCTSKGTILIAPSYENALQTFGRRLTPKKSQSNENPMSSTRKDDMPSIPSSDQVRPKKSCIIKYNPLEQLYTTYSQSHRRQGKTFVREKEAEVPSYIVLAHEMIHTIHHIDGTRLKNSCEPSNISAEFPNLEEQINITGLTKPLQIPANDDVNENQLKYDDINENQLRLEFATKEGFWWVPRMNHNGRTELGQKLLPVDFDTKYNFLETLLLDCIYKSPPPPIQQVNEIVKLLLLNLLKEKVSEIILNNSEFKTLFYNALNGKGSTSSKEIGKSILKIIENKNFYRGLLNYFETELKPERQQTKSAQILKKEMERLSKEIESEETNQHQ